MSRPDTASAFEESHDHQRCIRSALDTATRLCTSRNVRLTPVRRRVLELVWQSHRPLGAYQILGQLGDEGFNSAPPTVYRALDFLMEEGLIHRLASINAFIGCCSPNHRHHGHFLICRECGRAEELEMPELTAALHRNAADQGFLIESETVELSGLCPNCREPRA